MKFPFIVSSTRFVLTHGTYFMRRKRIFVMEIRDSNTGGEEGALDLFFLSIFKSVMNMKKLSWRMQLCYCILPCHRNWGNAFSVLFLELILLIYLVFRCRKYW